MDGREVIGKARENLLKRRQQLRGKVTKLTAQKEYEERKDYNKLIQKQKNLIHQKQKTINEAE